MFRGMRRKNQQLSAAACEDILRRGTAGVLALSGDEGYPYAVPMSYVYADGRLYFHSAKSGHKLDAIARCAKASFCVVDKDEIVPAQYTTHFRSVIVFGRMRVLTEDGERRAAMEALAVKYAPQENAAHRAEAIEREWTPLCVMMMEVEHMTGKEAIELVRARNNTEG